jgi:competence protein ComEA
MIRPLLDLANTTVRKININTADAAQLKQHPYINWTVANALIRYRQEHGVFKQIEDLQSVIALSPELIKKLTPYMSLAINYDLDNRDSLQKH